MKDIYKTKKQLMKELIDLRTRVNRLQASEIERNRAEKKLRESEKNYRELVQNANSIILRMDVNGNVKLFNKFAQEFFGYKEEEILGRNVVDTIVPEKELLQRDLRSLLVGFDKYPERYVYNEFENRRKNGEQVWVAWTNKAVFDENGFITEIISIGNDITDRRRIEEALRTSETNYRAIFNNVNDCIFIHDIKTGKIMDVNDKFTEMFGYTAEEAKQKYAGDFSIDIPPYTRKHALQWIRKSSRYGPQLFEWHCKHKSGGLFWGEVNLKRSVIMGRDYFLAIVRDVSKRKQAEQALAESKKKYETLYESSRDAIMLLTPERGFFSGNPATIELFKCKDEKEFNSKSSAYLSPKYQQDGELSSVKTKKMMAIAMKKGSHSFEWKHKQMDGTEFFSTVLLTRMELNGEKVLQATVRDITERKLAEKARKDYVKVLRMLSSKLISAQEDEKKRMARDIHDSIGQSLTAVKFRVENILQQMGGNRKGSIMGSLQEIIPMIQGTIEGTRRVIMDLRPSTLDDLGIVATISWYCREFERLYPGVRIEKQVNIQEDSVPEPLKITIYRILQESLHNISKHSQADLVRISLQKKDDTIILSIKDNGQGFNLEKAISMELSKRGYGLTSMKERTELSGGSFFTESIRKAGTVVRASWPV